MADRYNNYEAWLEAKRKDDEKRWREIANQIRQHSDLSGKYAVSPEVQAMQMSGYARPIGGGGGGGGRGGGGMSWLDKGVTPRPMLTPEQRKTAELQRVTEGKVRDAVEAEAEAKRKYYNGDGKFGATGYEANMLQAAIEDARDAYYKFRKDFGPEDPVTIALRNQWAKLAGDAVPEETGKEESSAPGLFSPMPFMWDIDPSAYIDAAEKVFGKEPIDDSGLPGLGGRGLPGLGGK